VKLEKKSAWMPRASMVAASFLYVMALAYTMEPASAQEDAAALGATAGEAQGRAGVFLTLDDAVSMALEGNPGLAAIEARARALSEIPEQRGTLPDPQISLNFMNLPVDTFSFSQEGMTQIQLGISQMIPYPGKLALQEQAAYLEAAAAEARVEEMRLQLARDVRVVWWTLYYFDRAIEIVRNNQDLLRQFVTIAQTKYKVGKGLQQDVLLAQVELSRFLDKEIALKGMRSQWEARLNALLDRDAASPVRLDRKVSEHLASLKDRESLRSLAKEARPLFAGLQKQIDASQSRLELAKKDYYPDFRVGAVYGFRSGQNPNGSDRADFASLMLSMNLPIHTSKRQDRQVDQRTSELNKTRYALADAWAQVDARIAGGLADYERAREQVSLFREGIIPQASQTVASMRAGYQVNKVDFLNLVRAQITLFNFETQYWKALSEAKQALAKLVAAVGKENIDE